MSKERKGGHDKTGGLNTSFLYEKETTRPLLGGTRPKEAPLILGRKDGEDTPTHQDHFLFS